MINILTNEHYNIVMMSIVYKINKIRFEIRMNVNNYLLKLMKVFFFLL